MPKAAVQGATLHLFRIMQDNGFSSGSKETSVREASLYQLEDLDTDTDEYFPYSYISHELYNDFRDVLCQHYAILDAACLNDTMSDYQCDCGESRQSGRVSSGLDSA
jgi:hypothetical protein